MLPDFKRLWAERYREGDPAWEEPLPDAVTLMLQHRSVRNFSDRPLPEHLVEVLVAAAQSAPTSSNKQFWSVVAVREPQRKLRLAEYSSQAKVAQAPLLLVWLADLSRIDAVGERAGRHLKGLDYLESFLVASIDVAFAAQNAVVAAEALGIGTVYIGGMRDKPKLVAAELCLPRKCVALFGLCLGYPADDVHTAIKPRLPQEAVLHREQYSSLPAAGAIARHDQHHQDFRQEQGLYPVEWSAHIMSRVAAPSALHGRELLKDALHQMGFKLH